MTLKDMDQLYRKAALTGPSIHCPTRVLKKTFRQYSQSHLATSLAPPSLEISLTMGRVLARVNP